MTTLDLFEPPRSSALSQWFSPAWIARRLALWLPVESEGYVLEPSAGSGEMVDALLRAGWPIDRIVAVELDPAWCAHLRRRFPGLVVYEGDFLALSWAVPPRHVLTNPPYEDGLDVRFLYRCVELAGPAGRVCTLVKTDIEYSSGRAAFWRDVARVERRARLTERPAFGRTVDGEAQGGAERNYVCLELAARSRSRLPGEVEMVAEEAWSRTDHEGTWTRALGGDRQSGGEPGGTPSLVGERGDLEAEANRANRGETEGGA